MDGKWTIEGPDDAGGYRIRDDTGKTRGRYADSKTAAIHHAWALQEIERLQAASASPIPADERLRHYPTVIAKLKEGQYTDRRVCLDIERLVNKAALDAEKGGG